MEDRIRENRDSPNQNKYDYYWEYNSGEEIIHNCGKYRNDLISIYNSRPDGISGLVFKKGKDNLNFIFI